MRKRKRGVAFLLAVALILTIAGCSRSQNLTSQIKIEEEGPGSETQVDFDAAGIAVTDFSVRLFQHNMKAGRSLLLSPISVLTALAMTANGAQNETLNQMEAVMGMKASELNEYIRAYRQQVPKGRYYELHTANSIWFKDAADEFQIRQDFLEKTVRYYDADIFKAPFDESTRQEINDWVKEETDEMIPEILDEIPERALVYLVNALAFEAEWREPYTENQVRSGSFTLEDGTEQDAVLMYSSEGEYLEDEKATGFIRYYEAGDYAFVALLPKEGVSVEEYVDSLTGAHLSEMLSQPEKITVYVAIPKFENEYSVEMSQILQDMGMKDAFDFAAADFSLMGSAADNLNLAITRVIHKTYISVTETGTRAGAATVVEMMDGGSVSREHKEVILNRPFVYLIIDCQNNIPLFMGTTMSVR